MKLKNGGLIVKLALVVLLFAASAVSVVGFMSFNESQRMKNAVDTDTIYENIYINDVNVGKHTKEEALARLQEVEVPDISEKTITIQCGGEKMEFSYQGLGVTYDYSAAVEEAYQYARTGALKERYEKITALKKEPVRITYEPEYTKLDVDVKNKIAEFTDKMYVAPVNATLTRTGGRFTITPEQNGQKANVDEALAHVEELIAANEGGVVEVDIEQVPPAVTAADFEKATSMIGAGATSFSGGSGEPRNKNLSNALSKINDYVVFPGEVFSTNAAFGDMTVENGYTMAKVIENGEFVDGMGGGVCQVSTTLYMALLEAELEIVERRNHSLKVGYADYGFDATLAGTYIDLKFRNDTDYPIFIEAYMDDAGGKVKVRIYGHEIHDPSRSLAFTNALLETLHPAAELVTEDPTLPLNARLEVTQPKTGYKYRLYKTVHENGQQIDHVVINESTYRSVRGEVRVGTGESVAYDDDGNPIVSSEIAGKLVYAQTEPEPAEENPEETPPEREMESLTPDIALEPEQPEIPRQEQEPEQTDSTTWEPEQTDVSTWEPERANEQYDANDGPLMPDL